jgi:hypothetical protein
MKERLANCMDLATARNWVGLLRELEPWKENAPLQLWAIVQFLAEQEKGEEECI